MRAGVIQRIVSRLLWFTALSLLVPLAMSVIHDEPSWWAFAVPALLAGVAAFAFARLPAARQSRVDTLRRREGFLAVVLGWLVLVWLTALAFYLTGAFAGFAECFFESMSGYTTMGATVVADVEALPRSVLFMRSFSHWIGGMGIIVLSVAVLPELGIGGMQLFAAESSGIDADKLAPRIATTAQRLWGIYVAITAAQTALLLAGGMSLFDAINHAMSTIGTGGFSTRNSSVAAFDSLYIEIVVIVFMFLSGMSFTLLFRSVMDLRARRAPASLLRSPELRLYTAITLSACLLVSIDVHARGVYDSAGEALRHGVFQTVSVITTTGFGTADFARWPWFSQLLLSSLMFIGGCAGSTAGGSKMVRLYVVAQHARIQLRRMIRPRLVQTLRVGDREVAQETTEAILGFYLLYSATLLVGSLGLTALGMDLVSGTTAAMSALGSVGPGLGTVGMASNFGHIHDAGLYLLSFGMLLGRLEIYPVLVLCTRHFWRQG